MNFKNINPVIKKEFIQLSRDKRSLLILLFIPAFMLVMFGYALNFDVKNISIAVYDWDKTEKSREFINRFLNSGYFRLTDYISDTKEIDKLMAEEKIKAAIVVPFDFANKISANKGTPVQIIVDGANSNSAAAIIGYISSITQGYSLEILLSSMKGARKKIEMPVDLRQRIWFNPELKSAKFLLPGLIAFILMVTAVVSTSLTIVREKERGTMEQLIISPVKPIDLIIGKTIPYIIISLLTSFLVILMSYVIFGVAIKGSYFLLFLITFIFLTGCLGIGLLISTIAETQQVAFILSVLFTGLPTFILSGFVFPIRNMPFVIQIITYIIPARYFLEALRGIILKGAGISAFWDQTVFMMVFALLTIAISAIRMNKNENNT